MDGDGSEPPAPATGPARAERAQDDPGAPRGHLFTIGHSTQSATAFCDQLRAQRVVTLADIRSIPGSNRNPQFHAEALADALDQVGIDYVHIAALGGRRNRQKQVDPEVNAAWRNASFRNYADYTTTPEFEAGLEELLALEGPVAYMCSEAVPWRCHRTIVSDNLVARGCRITHLMGATTKEHRLGAWGPSPRVVGDRVTYPDPGKDTSGT